MYGPSGDEPDAFIYRANPSYTAVLLDRLAPDERSALRHAYPGDDLYGVLMPRPASDLAVRSLSYETALLFFALLEPGPLPEFARRSINDGGSAAQRLLLDGVLEIADGAGFASGPRYLASRVAAADGTGGAASPLAVAALQYGQSLEGIGEDELALRLYGYGRRPLSPHLRRRLPDREAVAAALDIDRVREMLASEGWATAEDEHWYHLHAPRAGAPVEIPTPRYKLYISPLPTETGDALGRLVRACAVGPGPLGFKVAAGPAGFCRPDRLVVYLADSDTLSSFVETLRSVLAGCTGVGVPFTALITDDGLLSWGADPPRPAPGIRSTSWRMWLCRRLAHYLMVGRAADTGALEPWEFALQRLRLSGIDSTSWIPSPASWAEVLETG